MKTVLLFVVCAESCCSPCRDVESNDGDGEVFLRLLSVLALEVAAAPAIAIAMVS